MTAKIICLILLYFLVGLFCYGFGIFDNIFYIMNIDALDNEMQFVIAIFLWPIYFVFAVVITICDILIGIYQLIKMGIKGIVKHFKNKK